jgi:hypothetical protein
VNAAAAPRARMVVLLVDALGWELASSRPDLGAGLGHRRRLETVLGFSSGALPTLFTGRAPSEHGRFLMYRRATGGRTPFRGFGLTRWLPARLRRSWRLGRWLRAEVSRRGVRGYFELYDVPRELLPFFDLPERDDIFAPGGLPGGTLWDTLEDSGLRWRGWNWRTAEAESIAALERAVESGGEDVLFLYTADLDALLHREGSRGAGVRDRIGRYAALIERLEAAAARRGEALWLYLLSDHGMVDVTRTVDVPAALDALDVRWPRDYVPFLDSTFARFWWRDPAARGPVRAALERLGGGHWLDEAALRGWGTHFPDGAYGDDLFLCDPGVLVLPSFMGREAVAAMHGYDPAHPDMAAMLWSNRPIAADVTGLADVRRHLEHELSALRGTR